ncbi:MAG: hypothetical protein WA655_14170, partial [Candidatus Korobacteraceae bacterium]
MARLENGRRVRRYSLSVVLLAAILLLSVPWMMAAQSPQTGSDGILPHLNAAISWYRHVASLDVTAGQPSDVLYLDNARSAATQALQLAFQASLAQAALAQEQSGKSNGAGPQTPPDQQHGIAKALADTGAHIAQTQS